MSTEPAPYIPPVAEVPCTLQPDHQGDDCENWYAQESWPRTAHASEPVDPPWDEVPERDCYTKTSGQSCGPAHGWGSWLNTIYRCSGTRQSDDPAQQVGDYCECCDPDVIWCAKRPAPSAQQVGDYCECCDPDVIWCAKR